MFGEVRAIHNYVYSFSINSTIIHQKLKVICSYILVEYKYAILRLFLKHTSHFPKMKEGLKRHSQSWRVKSTESIKSVSLN